MVTQDSDQACVDDAPDIAGGAVKSAALGKLLAHWRSLQAGRRVPERRDFDPMRVPRLLPSIFLLGLERETGRFRVRVMGSRLSSVLGSPATGRYVEELGLPHDMQTRLCDLLATRAPFVLRGEIDLNDGNRVGYEVLGLPLAGDDGEVAFMLGGMDFVKLSAQSPRWL